MPQKPHKESRMNYRLLSRCKMETIPLPAFGYIVLKNILPVGCEINDELICANKYSIQDPSPFEDGNYGNLGFGYTWLYTRGKMLHTNTSTGETVERVAGWSNLVTQEEVGTFSIAVVEPMVTFCLNVQSNANRQPRIPVTQYFHLLAGEPCTLPQGTKLFFADGTLNINGSEISGPRQIRVASGDREVLAVSNCYGLLFP